MHVHGFRRRFPLRLHTLNWVAYTRLICFNVAKQFLKQDVIEVTDARELGAFSLIFDENDRLPRLSAEEPKPDFYDGGAAETLGLDIPDSPVSPSESKSNHLTLNLDDDFPSASASLDEEISAGRLKRPVRLPISTEQALLQSPALRAALEKSHLKVIRRSLLCLM